MICSEETKCDRGVPSEDNWGFHQKDECCCQPCNEKRLSCDHCCKCIPQRFCLFLRDEYGDLIASRKLTLTGEGSYGSAAFFCGGEVISVDLDFVSSAENCQWIVTITDDYGSDEIIFDFATDNVGCDGPVSEEHAIEVCGNSLTFAVDKNLIVPYVKRDDCRERWCLSECICRTLCLRYCSPDCEEVTARVDYDETIPGWRLESPECGDVELALVSDEYTNACELEVITDGQSQSIPMPVVGQQVTVEWYPAGEEGNERLRSELLIKCAECDDCDLEDYCCDCAWLASSGDPALVQDNSSGECTEATMFWTADNPNDWSPANAPATPYWLASDCIIPFSIITTFGAFPPNCLWQESWVLVAVQRNSEGHPAIRDQVDQCEWYAVLYGPFSSDPLAPTPTDASTIIYEYAVCCKDISDPYIQCPGPTAATALISLDFGEIDLGPFRVNTTMTNVPNRDLYGAC